MGYAAIFLYSTAAALTQSALSGKVICAKMKSIMEQCCRVLLIIIEKRSKEDS